MYSGSFTKSILKIQHAEILDNAIIILVTHVGNSDGSVTYIPLRNMCTYFKIPLEAAGA